jgi:hypothetical protein
MRRQGLTVSYGVRLSKTELALLKEVARKEDRSVGSVIRRLIRAHLSKGGKHDA